MTPPCALAALRAILLLAVACLCLPFAAGCAREPSLPLPETAAVKGKVFDSAGRPLDGGIIQFISRRDGRLNMSSIIGADGSFELQTIHGNQNINGVLVGPCEVIITPPIKAGAPPQIIVLREIYEVQPQENEFVIQLEP